MINISLCNISEGAWCSSYLIDFQTTLSRHALSEPDAGGVEKCLPLLPRGGGPIEPLPPGGEGRGLSAPTFEG